MEKWGSGGLLLKKFLRQRPFAAEQNIVLFIIDYQAKKEKLFPRRSYANVSLLKLHVRMSMLEAKQTCARKQSVEEKTLPTPDMHLTFAAWNALKRKKLLYSLKGSSPTRLPTASLQRARESKN